MVRDLFARENFSRRFAVLALIVTIVALCVDFRHPNVYHWFSRSGAFLTMAGVNYQYSILWNAWHVADHRPGADGTMRISAVIRRRREVAAVWFIVFGTVIWALGDLVVPQVS